MADYTSWESNPLGRVGNFMIAKFVSAALATLRTGGTDWISFQIGVPRVVTKSWIWFATPSFVVLLGPSETLGRSGIPGIGTSPSTY